jgi:hypothetical protein
LLFVTKYNFLTHCFIYDLLHQDSSRLFSHSIFYFLKITLGGAADGTYPVVRQFFEGCPRSTAGLGVSQCRIIDITADGAFVFCHSVIISFTLANIAGSSLGGSASLDLMIIFVGHAGIFIDNFRSDNPADKNSVGTYINILDNLGFQIGDGIIEDYGGFGYTYFIVNALQFVYISSRLEAEASDKRERRGLAENGSGENPAVFDELVGQIIFVNAYGDGWWLRGYLEYRVGSLAIEPVSLSGAYYIHAVAKLVQSTQIHLSLLWLHDLFFAGFHSPLEFGAQ